MLLCAENPPEQAHQLAAAVLIKTRVSEGRIVGTILAACNETGSGLARAS